VKWDDELYKRDIEYIHTSIKANIAAALWNRNKRQEIYYSMDKQIRKAQELFPEAVKIANLKMPEPKK
jgi:hypothetical protein